MTYSIQPHCRLCANDQLIDFFDLGSQALSGCFPGTGQASPPLAPLILCRCPNCHLVQLRHSTDPAKMFTHEYGYQSSLNAAMSDHLHELQSWITDRYSVTTNDLVIDIGANDGTLLKAWSGFGVQRVAIDPILDKFTHLYPKDIQQIADFFTSKHIGGILAGRKAKIITSISMFYDLPDPNDFVAGIASALADDGVWILEQSYLPTMLARNSFDTICHEHLEYYALKQIEWLADRYGLIVLDVALNDCNGGSFRLALGNKDGPWPQNTAAIARTQAIETKLALDTPAPYSAFARRVGSVKSETMDLLQELKSEGKTIWIYGASTKGNVLLQHYGIDASLVEGVIEVNPEKFGHFTPGSNLPIRSETGILAENPDYFLVLPWHFRENILARGQVYLDAGVKFIFPLPNLEVIGANSGD